MRQDTLPIIIHPKAHLAVGVLAAVGAVVFALLWLVDLLGLRPSTTPPNYPGMLAVLGAIALLPGLIAACFSVRVTPQRLEFRWLGVATRSFELKHVSGFTFEPGKIGRPPLLHTSEGDVPVYWIDPVRFARVLRRAGVGQPAVA